MVKLVGMILIMVGVISLLAGTFMNSNYGNAITANAVSGTSNGLMDYAEASVMVFSILCFIVGSVFLFRF